LGVTCSANEELEKSGERKQACWNIKAPKKVKRGEPGGATLNRSNDPERGRGPRAEDLKLGGTAARTKSKRGVS